MSEILNINPYTHAETNRTNMVAGPFESPIFEPDHTYGNEITASPPEFVHTYTFTQKDLAAFREVLWDNDITSKLERLFGADLLNGIISFGLTYVPNTIETTISNIQIGSVLVTANAARVLNPRWETTIAATVFKRYFGNFLDFEPYTKITLHVPNMGDFSIRPSDVMGKTAFFVMSGDIGTGDLHIYGKTTDGTILFSHTGRFMVNIPLSSKGNENNSKNAIDNIAGAVAGSIQNIIGFAKSMAQDITGWNPTPNTANTINVESSYLDFQEMYYKIERPSYSLPSNYGKYNGYPSNIETKLSNALGYYEINNIIWDNDIESSQAGTNRKPTTKQINAIIEMLKQGVYKYDTSAINE